MGSKLKSRIFILLVHCIVRQFDGKTKFRPSSGLDSSFLLLNEEPKMQNIV